MIVKCNHFDCLNEQLCSETQYCLIHCFSKNHFHCDFLFCDNINFLYDSTCITHCDSKNHGHYINYECENTFNICKKSNLCVKHCFNKLHFKIQSLGVL